MSVTNKEILTFNIEDVNLYVIGEILYNLSSLEFPKAFDDRIAKLNNDIFNYLFPVSKKFSDCDALEQKWSVTTYYTKGGRTNASI